MAICDPFIDCDKKELTWEQLVKMLSAISSDNCPALRVIFF